MSSHAPHRSPHPHSPPPVPPRSRPTSDTDLFRAWRAGDERAGQALFRRLRVSLRAWFRDCPPHVIDDLVQETMVACVEARDRLRCDEAFVGYLRRIALRVLLRYRYRTRTYEVLDERVLDESLPPAAADELLDLQMMMEICPCPHVVIVALRYLVGLPGVEIAGLMGISEASVRRRLRRGLEELRRVACQGTVTGLRRAREGRATR